MNEFKIEEFKKKVKEHGAEENKVFLFIESCPSRKIFNPMPFLEVHEAQIVAGIMNALDSKYSVDNVEAEFGLFKITANQIIRIMSGGELTHDEFEKARMIEYQFVREGDAIVRKVINNLTMPFDIRVN